MKACTRINLLRAAVSHFNAFKNNENNNTWHRIYWLLLCGISA